MKAITTFLFVLNMMLTLNSIGGDITYVTSRGGINTGDTNSLQLPQSSSGSVNYISIDNRIVFSVNHDHDSINEVVDKVEVELHVEMKKYWRYTYHGYDNTRIKQFSIRCAFQRYTHQDVPGSS